MSATKDPSTPSTKDIEKSQSKLLENPFVKVAFEMLQVHYFLLHVYKMGGINF